MDVRARMRVPLLFSAGPAGGSHRSGLSPLFLYRAVNKGIVLASGGTSQRRMNFGSLPADGKAK
jgi:hypothetical protein